MNLRCLSSESDQEEEEEEEEEGGRTGGGVIMALFFCFADYSLLAFQWFSFIALLLIFVGIIIVFLSFHVDLDFSFVAADCLFFFCCHSDFFFYLFQ